MIRKKQVINIILLLSVIQFNSCSKGEPDRSERATSETEKTISGDNTIQDRSLNKEIDITEENSRQKNLDLFFLQPKKQAHSRMLEYKVSLTYETAHFRESRRSLITVISENGFITSSYATTTGPYPYQTINFAVKTDTLYEILKKIDILGELKSEQISVIDHTPDMVWQKIKINREQLRLTRKNKTIAGVRASSKQMTARESSLERSEDMLDKAKLEKWKLRDKIEWAKITLHLRGPELPRGISVPTYKNALTGILNLVLYMLYGLIYVTPFLILFIIIWKTRHVIKRFLSGKSK